MTRQLKGIGNGLVSNFSIHDRNTFHKCRIIACGL